MKDMIRIISIFLLISKIYSQAYYILYDTGNAELRVNYVLSQSTRPVKSFKIQTDTASGGIAADSERDQLFFADGRNIYRIYMVDDSGERKVSKNGELFYEPSAQHFEVRLFIARRKIEGIFYDSNTTKLHAAADTDLIELDSTTGKVLNSRYVGYNRYVRNPFMHHDVMYVYQYYGRQRYYGYTWGIYDNKKNRDKALVYGNGEHLSGFTVDGETGKLFLNMRSTIRVIDVNEVNDTDRLNPRIVLGDSKYTRGLQSIAVHGNYIFWIAAKLKNLYRGTLHNGMFIRTTDVVKFDENVTSQYLCVFPIMNIGDPAEANN